MKVTGQLPGEHVNQPKVIGAEPDFKRSGNHTLCPGCGIYLQSSNQSLSVTCPACNTSGFQFPDNVPTCEGCGTRGLCAVVDGVHWKFWVPWPPEVTQKFCGQADEETGISERIHKHGAQLSEWLHRKPHTIRYMNSEELAILRKETIDALMAQGATRERAEELTASLPTGGERLQPVAEHAVDTEANFPGTTSSTESTCPISTTTGDLVIPFDCPAKYRWWQGG